MSANWTLIDGELDTLKSEMYCGVTGDTLDSDLTLLGEMLTDQMYSELNNPAIDIDEPTLELQRACLKQCAHEFKQRKTPGLQSVTFTDGSINKMQIDEWLLDVKKILQRNKRYSLYETV